MANTLYDYYTGQGQTLPSVSSRAATATAAGISNYTGTAEQNNALLSYLQKSPTTTTPNNSTYYNQNATVQGGALTPNEGFNPGAPKIQTPVVSSAPALKQIDNMKSTISSFDQSKADADAKSAADQAAKDALDAQTLPTDKYLKGSNKPNPNYQPTPETPKTPEQLLAEQPPEGQAYFYNARGEKTTLPDNGITPAGYSRENPATKPTAETLEDAGGSGITIKKFVDGTYGRFTAQGDFSPATAAEFNNLKDVNDLYTAKNNAAKGIYSDTQKAQLDGIMNDYNNKIATQQDINKTFGNALVNQGVMSGIPMIQESNITTMLRKGFDSIASLTTARDKDIADMKSAFLSDDINVLNSAYTSFRNNSTAIQNNIDKLQAATQEQITKLENKNADVNIAMAKKYSDTIDPILVTDTPAQRQAKLETSESYVNDEKAKAGLNKSQLDFWSQVSMTPGGNLIKLPNIGFGGSSLKTVLMQNIADSAIKVGLTGKDVAQSLLDKSIKTKTLQKISDQGTRLATDENAVKDDFNRVKELGKGIKDQDLQAVAQPFLKAFLQGVDLKVENNPALSSYLASLHTTLTKYGRVVNAQTGASGTTVAANDAAQALVNKGMTVDTVNQLIDSSFIPEMNNTVNNFNKSAMDLQNSINQMDGTLTPGLGITGSAGTSSTTDPLGLGI
jgi:hypothetical protein